MYRGTCAHCDSIEAQPADSEIEPAKPSQAHPTDETTMLQHRYDSSTVVKLETPPQTCQLVPGLSLTTSRCEIPYYASSFNPENVHSTAISMPATVSTSTLSDATWINFMAKPLGNTFYENCNENTNYFAQRSCQYHVPISSPIKAHVRLSVDVALLSQILSVFLCTKRSPSFSP